MSNLPLSPASTSGATRTTFARPAAQSLAEVTAQNRAAALSATTSTEQATIARRSPVLKAGAAVLTAAALLGAGATQANARVLPVPVVTAHQGPTTVPSGLIRCTAPGDFHATLAVRTTTRDRKGDHHVAVWLQQHQGGRARLVGYAWSTKRVVKVVVCVNPGKVDGTRGPIDLIVSDAVDGYTRPVEVRFPSAR